MRIAGEDTGANLPGQDAEGFAFSSENRQITVYIRIFNQLEAQRRTAYDVKDKLSLLKKELKELKNLYDYVMAVTPPVEDRVTVDGQSIEFRRKCSETFGNIVGELRVFYDSEREAMSRPSESIEDFFTYLGKDALVKLKDVPADAPILSCQTEDLGAQKWAYAYTATKVLGGVASVGLGGVGGVETYLKVVENPEVLGEVASSVTGMAFGAGVATYAFFQPATPVTKINEAETAIVLPPSNL